MVDSTNLPEVDINAIATDLNGKADTDLTNCTKPHITETYVSSDGLSWYRIYSDGWCEQGIALQLSTNANNTITLLKAYKDMTYQVLMRQNYIETGNVVVLQAQKMTEQTIEANLKHAVSDTYYSRYCSFYTYGYIR